MADVVVTMSSDVARLLRDQERVNEKQQRTIDKLSATVRASKDTEKAFASVGKVGADSFGTKLSSALETAVTRFVSMEVAVRVVGDAMRFVQQETDKAVRSFDALEETRRRLTQVSVSASDLQAQTFRADELAKRYGVDRKTVQEVLFAARSEGFEGSVESIIRNAPVVSPQAQAGVAGQLPTIFRGAITPEQAINATLAAAVQSRLPFEGIATALPGAAEGAAMTGTSPAETLALQSTLSSLFKSGETAADRIKAFGAFASLQEGLGGRGIVSAVDTLSQMDEATRRETLGTGVEVNAAYNAIAQEMATIRERTTAIQQAIEATGTPAAIIEQRRADFFSPATAIGRQNAAKLEAQRVAMEREIANERQLAASGFATQAALDRVLTEQKTTGVPAAVQYLGDFSGSRVREFTANPYLTERAARFPLESIQDPTGLVRLIQSMQSQSSSTEAASTQLLKASQDISQAAAALRASSLRSQSLVPRARAQQSQPAE